VLAVVLLTAVSAMTWLAVGRALAPVAAMTRSAAEWSDRELDRRFGTEPRPDELARLARTFDDLLDRVAASLRHEQRLSAELSHELRTPLARITAEIDLLKQRERPAAERNEAYAAVLRSTDQMRRILETLMAAARAESQPGPRGRTDLGPALAGLAEDWGPSFAERGVALEVRPTANQIAVGVDPDVLERVIAPLLDNARRYARARGVIGAERTNGRARVTVRDDGEGLAPGDADRIFEPGVRGERDAGAPGAGLGLPLARRLARASGGDVAAGEDDGEAGALFEVELPT
jgi:signal transduction histidine kinase